MDLEVKFREGKKEGMEISVKKTRAQTGVRTNSDACKIWASVSPLANGDAGNTYGLELLWRWNQLVLLIFQLSRKNGTWPHS